MKQSIIILAAMVLLSASESRAGDEMTSRGGWPETKEMVAGRLAIQDHGMQQRVGCVSLILFVFGFGVLISPFIPAEYRGDGQFSWSVCIPLGLGLLVAGTYRKSITLDRHRRTVETCQRIVQLARSVTRLHADSRDSGLMAATVSPIACSCLAVQNPFPESC